MIFENGHLKQMLVDGGYIPMDDWSGTYRFYVKDHLGNNRMVIHPSGNAEEVNNYYPYGGLMANSTGWNAQRYKYNGKEFDRMHGLDWYDYGARWMDASIGRWHSIDPLAEKYYDVSPYLYCNGNPISQFDPDGCSSWKIIAKGAFRITKTVAKQGFSALNKATTYANAFTDIVEDTKSIFDSNASVTDRVFAGVSLASEVFSPVSIKDAKGIKDATNTLRHNINPKKLARQQAKEVRDQQPASEQYARYKAKELEKKEGKDARRKAHDAKERGEPDRSKKQIDEDYKRRSNND